LYEALGKQRSREDPEKTIILIRAIYRCIEGFLKDQTRGVVVDNVVRTEEQPTGLAVRLIPLPLA
jgi:hypothetical protein